MAMKSRQVRVCDNCEEERSYKPEECDTYINLYGKKCLAPPKRDMISLHIPAETGRTFLDFCCLDCLRSWVVDNIDEKSVK